MEKIEINKKKLRLENWLEKLQSENGENIGRVGEKILSRKMGVKNTKQKMDGTILSSR